MLTYLIKLSFRNFFRHKTQALISLLGLVIGFTAFILLSLLVHYERSWDRHNVNYERICRVQRNFINDHHGIDGNNISPHTRGMTARLLEGKYPEIEKTVVIKQVFNAFLGPSPEKLFYNKTGIFADSSYFNVFTIHFTQGDQAGALREPFTVILSQTMANKIFPGQSALGKTVNADKKYHLKVTGIYEDLPLNSHMRPDYFISMSTIQKDEDVYNSPYGNFMTYVLVKPGTDSKTLSAKIRNLFENYEDIKYEKLMLCPLSKIYLSFNDRTDYLVFLFLLSLIGLLILTLSSINYINLTTANASIRAKEVGVQKVHGSSGKIITLHFLLESVIMAIAALAISFLLTRLMMPVFNHMVNKEINMTVEMDLPFLLKLSSIAIGVGLLSGLYPAFFMVNKHIPNLFKGNIFKQKKETISIRKILVSFQFAAAIFLIVLTLFMAFHIKYLLHKDLGFAKTNLLVTKITSSRKDAGFNELRQRIMQHPEIINCSMQKHVPFLSFGGGTTDWEGAPSGEVVNFRDNYVSYDFVKNMEIQIIKGRDFSKDYPADAGKACLINEKALKIFGWKNPIGKHINGNRWEVVGVVKDFCFKDMHNSIEPAAMVLYDGKMEGEWSFAFRVAPNDLTKATQIVKNELSAFFPNDPFELYTLENVFETENVMIVYASVDKTFLFFSIVNIVLAIFGLIGLLSFTIERKTKEIGVRKINGSSSWQIFYTLNKEMILLVVYSSVFAWTGAYAACTIIPGENKHGIDLWLFVAASFLVIIIVICISGYQTYRASTRNPVEALRYE